MEENKKVPGYLNSMAAQIGYLEGSIQYFMMKLKQVDSDNAERVAKEVAEGMKELLQTSNAIWEDLKSKGRIH